MDDRDTAGATNQLLLFGFGPGATFEGQLVGALERIESGGALRILDALFVQRDPETGDLSAIALHGAGAGGLVAPLLGFRLDPAERRRTSVRTLAAADVQALGEALAPGEAVAAVLVEHVWSRVLDDAVARTGGTPLAREFVSADTLSALTDRVLDGRRGPLIMAGSAQPDEFRYHDDGGRSAFLSRFAVAGLLVFASMITGLWGVASLLHASWLETNDLPVGDYIFWGVAMLCLATLQGLTALLLVFGRLLGIVLGILLAALNIAAQVTVISAYPVWSLVGIAVNLLVIAVLVAARRRR